MTEWGWTHLCMKCSRGISNVLEEISSLSDSIVSLYFFALITEEGRPDRTLSRTCLLRMRGKRNSLAFNPFNQLSSSPHPPSLQTLPLVTPLPDPYCLKPRKRSAVTPWVCGPQ